MIFNIDFMMSRIQAAWAVLTSKRCVVITYDPAEPASKLGNVYLCAPCQEVPERLANATLVAVEWDKIDSSEGQQDALRQAKELLDCSSSMLSDSV